MPRKKIISEEQTTDNEKVVAEVKPKRKRRTPAEMEIFRAEQAAKKLQREKERAEKIAAEAARPKRKRRTPAEMEIFRAEQAAKKLQREKKLAEKKLQQEKESAEKKLQQENEQTKKISSEKTGGLAQKKSSPEKIDYKIDGKEKLFALDIGTRSVIGIVAEQNDDGALEIIATHRDSRNVGRTNS